MDRSEEALGDAAPFTIHSTTRAYHHGVIGLGLKPQYTSEQRAAHRQMAPPPPPPPPPKHKSGRFSGSTYGYVSVPKGSKKASGGVGASNRRRDGTDHNRGTV